ncbi:hypothetical protein FSARC_12719 [Fusarium sarcochroum]|uniref:CENP-T/Histone H4 histone fold domain-containing protein n=1 Tax=Fusarium sarcochroum TaxID=1208366 RepID=A0A8H4T630_9HYPO|nr:hypothetical protein FSARC_12719 [Fusarium sarcochroum]
MSSPISPPVKAASQETPARTPSRTPNRRAISAEPYSARASVHTPLDRTDARDLRVSLRRGTPASAGRSNAPTPHAKAARRALDQRRTAMFTPGKNRRRSLMQQRETPLDVLRTLGRVLAPTSRPIQSSSSSSPGNKSSVSPEQQEPSNMYDDDDDDDDDLLTRPPRLSLPMDDDASSMSSDLPPPRLSQIDEDNFTVQSIEMPRRYETSRLSRGSFGSVRESDYFNNDPTEDDIGQQSDFFPGLLEDLQRRADEDDLSLGQIDADQTRRMTEGRGSDFNFQIPDVPDEQTVFQMSDPADDVQRTSPIVDQSVAEARGEEAQDPALDVVFGSDSDPGGAEFPMDGWDYDDGGVDDHSSINEPLEPVWEPTTTAAVHYMPADNRLPRGLKANKKRKRISQHGIEYPALPPAFVKRVAQTALQSSGLSNQRLSAETLDALIQSSEWFFEQLGDDLGAYADHAKRKTIEESDVFTLMKRQRQIGPRSSMFSLAQKHLARELLQELRMPVPQPVKQRKAKRVSDQGDERDVAEYT